MRKIARTALWCVCGLLAASLGAELVLQATVASPLWRVLPVPEVAVYGPDRFTGYRHRPNVQGVWLQENRSWVKTSNLGLRDRERSLTRTDAPRAVVIGNSILEALQVELPQTAVFVAEQQLQRRRPGAEVINLGLAGASPPVMAARLRTLGVSFQPDVAVVVLPVTNLLSMQMTDDSNFTGYGRGGDGQFHLSYGFRNTRGYHFRTSKLGRLFYWSLDHSALMRVINSRMNVGVLAEWPRRAGRNRIPSECNNTRIADELALWRDHQPDRLSALLDAFIRDLSEVSATRGISVVVAITSLNASCAQQLDLRRATVAAIRQRLEAANLHMFDLDSEVAARVGPRNVRQLRGFGNRLGAGHLNVNGNRVVGELLAAAIDQTISAR